jgi:hypothetical protein
MLYLSGFLCGTLSPVMRQPPPRTSCSCSAGITQFQKRAFLNVDGRGHGIAAIEIFSLWDLDYNILPPLNQSPSHFNPKIAALALL